MTKTTINTAPTPVLVSWSSGKDSAWALHTLRQQPEHYDVRGIFTTVTKTFDRVSIHSTPAWVLKQQAEKLSRAVIRDTDSLPMLKRNIRSSDAKVSGRSRSTVPDNMTASHFAFGDLFLEDIRAYREEKLNGTGFTPIFPRVGRGYNTTCTQNDRVWHACNYHCSQSD